MSNMVQYGLWPNCCNRCDFCLIKEKEFYSKKKQLETLDYIKNNINYIDWENKFDLGISLLGGEVYFMTDPDLQKSYLELIDIIIEKVLKKSKNPACRYSTVTNGLYNPEFLFKVVDRIADQVGLQYVDVNFSYDLKYRYKSERDRLLVLENINKFHDRYNYKTGVQMILTQNVINLWKEGKFKVSEFIENDIPGNMLCFLYPHPIHTGKILDDFFFKRKDFLKFIMDLRSDCFESYASFLRSTKNSCILKYTGNYDKHLEELDAQPVLSEDKADINTCGHSTLYKCYADCDKCMLCDLELLDSQTYL